MKHLLLLLPLALAAPLAAAPASSSSSSTGAVVPLRLAVGGRAPSPLQLRLQAIRDQHAASRAPDLLSERRLERIARSRPLPADSLGSLHRRQRLGDRTLPSADDRRLGSELRRQLLAGRPVQSLLLRR